MTTFKLEHVKKILKAFSPTEGDYFSENCIVVLENNNHRVGSILEVIGEKERSFSLTWNSNFSKAGYKMHTKLTENAAIAISSFLTREFTEFAFVEEAKIGTGIDFWLSYPNEHPLYDPKNFFSARIEISGINKESPSNTLESRVKEKKVQSKASDASNLPAYVSVIEFSTLKAYFGKQ